MLNRWRRGGHYAKIVLQADDLQVAERYINDRGFRTVQIIDEGRTEIDPLTPTAIGVEIVDKDAGHVQDTFSAFKLYRERKPTPAPAPRRSWKDCFHSTKSVGVEPTPVSSPVGGERIRSILRRK